MPPARSAGNNFSTLNPAVRAAIHNRSMEDEARDILRNVLSAEAVESPRLGSAIAALFAPLGGLDLPPIERQPMREPPSFDR